MNNIKLLTEFYDNFYFENECPYYNSCKTHCNFQLNFYRGRVGKNYGKGIPKILVIGKEPVFPKDYNGEKIKFEVKEPVTMAEAGYNDHYLRTFYTIAKLLDVSDMPKSYLKNDIGQEKYEYLRHCFAFTNFYKCVFSDSIKHTDKDTSKIMEANCTEILIKEIEYLKPDIVIFQGKNHETFWEKKTKCEEIEHKDIIVQSKSRKCNYNQGLYFVKSENHAFYVIDSYHPTSRGIWVNNDVHTYFLQLLEQARIGCKKISLK